ncbi:DUF5017 domain-containing protein [Mangrovibacterium lignilyticum]|uniref:hypothetical protein n=1 Tax=Mangrovibacterium lignilyticum TaxID=2668052 RepID=UPI0013D005EA|nr:hypothetical protein [Mangrovibacterium lignilyticum]
MIRPLLILLICVFSSIELKAQIESTGIQNDSIRIPIGGNLLPVHSLTIPSGTGVDLSAQFSLLPSASVQTSFSMADLSERSVAGWPVYPGLADLKNYGGTIGEWYYKQQFGFAYGVFLSQQSGYSFSSTELGIGTSILLRYRLAEQLQFLVWGQYFTPLAERDPVLKLPFMFNQSKAGSAIQYSPDDKSKFQIGVEYEYDPQDKSWKAESGGKVQFKF